MPSPSPGDVHVNRPLSNISVAFVQGAESFISDSIFPNIPVSKQSDLYFVHDQGSGLRNDMTLRAPGTESKGTGFKLSQESYYCHVYSFHHDVEDERRANADSPLMVDREATQFVTDKAILFREANWASNFFGTGVWDSDIAGVAAAPGANQVLQWSDAASTPIEDIRGMLTSMLQNTGKLPNTLVLGREVADALLDHPDILDRLKYGQTSGKVANTELTDLAALFKIPRVFVMNAIHNTAEEGATDSYEFIGDSKSALLCYAAPNAGLRTASAGYSFSWNGLLGASAIGSRIRKFRMEGINSDRIEIDMAYSPKVVASQLGTFITTAVA